MELAVNSVITFLLLYFIYYYVLRFIQFVFQESLNCINRFLSRFIYVVGTPAHELAHLLVAIVCLSRIENVKLFPTGNEPGYVKYSVSSSIPFFIGVKEFFISIAPALINIPLFIFIECKYVLETNVHGLNQILLPETIFSKKGIITLGLFIVLVSGIAPSHADLKGTVKGLIVFSVLIFGLTYFTGYIINIRSFNIQSLISVVFYYFEIIIFTLLVNVIIHFRNCFNVIGCIFKSSLKHTFSKA